MTTTVLQNMQILYIANVTVLLQQAVEGALKKDRTPVEGRPMYVSNYVDKTANPDATSKQFQVKVILDNIIHFVLFS